MTLARCHLPDQTVDIERCTSERKDIFVPEHERIHAYCFARAVSLHHQQPHAAAVTSWRVREIATDLAGTRGSFTRTFHSLMTQFARSHLGPIDHVWENARPQEQVCVAAAEASDPGQETFEEAIRACVETWLGPVRDGACNHPDEYDGFMIRPADWGEEITVERPALASMRTSLPAEVSFTPMPPPGGDMTLAEKIEYAEQQLARALPEALREGRQSRRRRLRRRMRVRKPRPNFRGSATAVEQAETEFALWLEFYADCRDTFPEDQTVVFPAGTVRFRMLGAICDPNPVTRCL